MNERGQIIEAFLLVILGLAAAMVIYGSVIDQQKREYKSYRQGQIDALNGKIKYHLVATGDGTTEWMEVGK